MPTEEDVNAVSSEGLIAVAKPKRPRKSKADKAAGQAFDPPRDFADVPYEEVGRGLYSAPSSGGDLEDLHPDDSANSPEPEPGEEDHTQAAHEDYDSSDMGEGADWKPGTGPSDYQGDTAAEPYLPEPLPDQGESHQLDLSDLILPGQIVTLDSVPLHLIQPDANPKAGEGLLRSVKLQGIRVPPILSDGTDPGTYAVIDGSRRIDAARQAGILEILKPGYYPVPITDPRAQAMRVSLNRIRSENPGSEARALWSMLAEGAEETAISSATEVPIKEVRKWAQVWGRLLADLRDAFATGKISPQIAQRASELDHETQAKLVAILEREGRLTLKDVEHFSKTAEPAQVSFLASTDHAVKAEKMANEGAKHARQAGWERGQWMAACMTGYDGAIEAGVALGDGEEGEEE